VTVQPIIFTLMFAYIFGGAIAGNVESYLPALIPGILVQTVITTSVVTGTQLREDMDKGVFDRFRSLPIARIAPLSGRCWPTPCVMRSRPPSRSSSASSWATTRPGLRRGRRGRTARHRLLVGHQLDLRVLRRHRSHGIQRAGHLDAHPVPAHVPVERVRADRLAARTARLVRECEPDLSPRDRGARSRERGGHRGGLLGLALGAAVIVLVFAPLTVRAYMRKA
jgi:ABC-2 type transport system permease protein